jgi:hypothetical protein
VGAGGIRAERRRAGARIPDRGAADSFRDLTSFEPKERFPVELQLLDLALLHAFLPRVRASQWRGLSQRVFAGSGTALSSRCQPIRRAGRQRFAAPGERCAGAICLPAFRSWAREIGRLTCWKGMGCSGANTGSGCRQFCPDLELRDTGKTPKNYRRGVPARERRGESVFIEDLLCLFGWHLFWGTHP